MFKTLSILSLFLSLTIIQSQAITNAPSVKILTAQETTNLVNAAIGSVGGGGTNVFNVLKWIGTTDGNTYRPVVTLVGTIPVLSVAVGGGTNTTPILDWVGPSNGNNYEAAVTMVDGIPVGTVNKL